MTTLLLSIVLLLDTETGLAADLRPGVILLLRGKHDEDYLRCLLVCRHLEIELRTVEVDARGN